MSKSLSLDEIYLIKYEAEELFEEKPSGYKKELCESQVKLSDAVDHLEDIRRRAMFTPEGAKLCNQKIDLMEKTIQWIEEKIGEKE